MEKIILLCLIMGAIMLLAEWPRAARPQAARPQAAQTRQWPHS